MEELTSAVSITCRKQEARAVVEPLRQVQPVRQIRVTAAAQVQATRPNTEPAEVAVLEPQVRTGLVQAEVPAVTAFHRQSLVQLSLEAAVEQAHPAVEPAQHRVAQEEAATLATAQHAATVSQERTTQVAVAAAEQMTAHHKTFQVTAATAAPASSLSDTPISCRR